MRNVAPLVMIADDLRWLASRAAPGGPIRTLLAGAAEQIDRAVEDIHAGCCPDCGGRSRYYWLREEAQRVSVIRQSYAEDLIGEDDVYRLLYGVERAS